MASKFDSSQLYTCENCGKSFQTNKSLKDHETTHKEVPSPCDICNKVYKSNKQLKHHKSLCKHIGINHEDFMALNTTIITSQCDIKEITKV